jgi:uncharacterized protein
MDKTKRFAKADELYEGGRYKEAFDLFLGLAEEGDPSATSRIADMFGSGKGTDYNFEKSVEWDMKAVELGSPVSRFNLGVSYRTKGDVKRAKYWFEEALRFGDDSAAVELAKLYMVSDLENNKIASYLKLAIESANITEDDRREALALFEELSKGAK